MSRRWFLIIRTQICLPKAGIWGPASPNVGIRGAGGGGILGGGLGVFVAHWGSWRPGVLSRDERAKQGSSKAQQRLRNGRMGIKRRQRAGKRNKKIRINGKKNVGFLKTSNWRLERRRVAGIRFVFPQLPTLSIAATWDPRLPASSPRFSTPPKTKNRTNPTFFLLQRKRKRRDLPGEAAKRETGWEEETKGSAREYRG